MDKTYQPRFSAKRERIYLALCAYFALHGRLPTVREACDVLVDAGIRLRRSMVSRHYRALQQLGKLVLRNGALQPAAEVNSEAVPPLFLLKVVDARRHESLDSWRESGEVVVDPRFFGIVPGANYYGVRFHFRLEQGDLTVRRGDMLVIMERIEDEPADVEQRGWALVRYGKRYDLWRATWFERPSRHLLEVVRKTWATKTWKTKAAERAERHVRCIGSIVGLIRSFAIIPHQPKGVFRSEPPRVS